MVSEAEDALKRVRRRLVTKSEYELKVPRETSGYYWGVRYGVAEIDAELSKLKEDK